MQLNEISVSYRKALRGRLIPTGKIKHHTQGSVALPVPTAQDLTEQPWLNVVCLLSHFQEFQWKTLRASGSPLGRQMEVSRNEL